MRILVTGSRKWTDVERLTFELLKAINEGLDQSFCGQPIPITLVHGACPSGADAIASEAFTKLQRTVRAGVLFEEPHPADWDRYGKSAGFRRNAEMVDRGADLCLAFITTPRTKGTDHTVSLARGARIPVREVVSHG